MSTSQHPSVHTRYCGDTRVLQAGTYIDPVTSRPPHVTRAQGIDGWKTPSPLRKIERKGESNLVDRSKTTRNLTPFGRVDPNGFAALLGAGGDEGIVGGNDGKVPSKATRGSTPSATNSVLAACIRRVPFCP